jgi:DNA repair protein RadC
MPKRSTKAKTIPAPVASPVLALCEPAAIAILPDDALLDLFTRIGAAVNERFLKARQCLNSWNLVLEYLRSTIGTRRTEQFRVLFLDKRNNLIADEAMGNGTIDHCPVYPREVAKRAFELGATALILAHNHPTDDTTPSSADIKMTQTLAKSLDAFGITIHDHIVVGLTRHTSMKSLRLI